MTPVCGDSPGSTHTDNVAVSLNTYNVRSAVVDQKPLTHCVIRYPGIPGLGFGVIIW